MSSTTVVYGIRLTYLITCVMNVFVSAVGISMSWHYEEHFQTFSILGLAVIWQILWLISTLVVLGQRTRREVTMDRRGKLNFGSD